MPYQGRQIYLGSNPIVFKYTNCHTQAALIKICLVNSQPLTTIDPASQEVCQEPGSAQS